MLFPSHRQSERKLPLHPQIISLHAFMHFCSLSYILIGHINALENANRSFFAQSVSLKIQKFKKYCKHPVKYPII